MPIASSLSFCSKIWQWTPFPSDLQFINLALRSFPWVTLYLVASLRFHLTGNAVISALMINVKIPLNSNTWALYWLQLRCLETIFQLDRRHRTLPLYMVWPTGNSEGPKTVDTHRRQIMDKLAVSSIAELTKYAIRSGLTSLDTWTDVILDAWSWILDRCLWHAAYHGNGLIPGNTELTRNP